MPERSCRFDDTLKYSDTRTGESISQLSAAARSQANVLLKVTVGNVNERWALLFSPIMYPGDSGLKVAYSCVYLVLCLIISRNFIDQGRGTVDLEMEG